MKTKTATTKKAKDPFANYPKKPFGKPEPILYPVKISNDEQRKKLISQPKIGSWVGVWVKIDGFTFNPLARPYKTQAECQEACDRTNRIHGYTEDEVINIVSASMEIKLRK